MSNDQQKIIVCIPNKKTERLHRRYSTIGRFKQLTRVLIFPNDYQIFNDKFLLALADKKTGRLHRRYSTIARFKQLTRVLIFSNDYQIFNDKFSLALADKKPNDCIVATQQLADLSS